MSQRVPSPSRLNLGILLDGHPKVGEYSIIPCVDISTGSEWGKKYVSYLPGAIP